jgi:hypothetical protein
MNEDWRGLRWNYKEEFCSKFQDKLYGRKHPKRKRNKSLHAKNSTGARPSEHKYTCAPSSAHKTLVCPRVRKNAHVNPSMWFAPPACAISGNNWFLVLFCGKNLVFLPKLNWKQAYKNNFSHKITIF